MLYRLSSLNGKSESSSSPAGQLDDLLLRSRSMNKKSPVVLVLKGSEVQRAPQMHFFFHKNFLSISSKEAASVASILRIVSCSRVRVNLLQASHTNRHSSIVLKATAEELAWLRRFTKRRIRSAGRSGNWSTPKLLGFWIIWWGKNELPFEYWSKN